LSGFRIEGNTSGNVAEVNSNNELTTALTQTSTDAGFAAIVLEHDAGSVTGSRYVIQADGSTDYRLRVGTDTLSDNDVFNYAAQNTARHAYYNTTMTATWASGFLNTNGSGITTTTTGVKFNTYKMFPVYGACDVWFEWTAKYTGTWAVTNSTIDVGAFLAPTSTPYAPTDGVYFRADSSGMKGIVNYAGVETPTGVFKVGPGLSAAAWAPVIGTVYKFGISVNNGEVEFWIEDVLMGEVTVPSGNGAAISCGSVPFAVRQAHVGAASAVQGVSIADYTCTIGDLNTSKLWSHQNAGMGLMAHQGQSGQTMGPTVSLGNNNLPAGAGGSNTTALVTGLGGIGQLNAAAGAATDYIATSFLNPAGTSAATGRTLYITGVRISAINYGAAVATTPTTLQWSLAFGHTAVSLATADAATAKAPRRIPLGFQTAAVGAAIGALYSNDIFMPFESPIVVNPGEYIASTVKQIVGTATASQTIVFTVGFDGYYE
jgi:hypothetical protein